MQPAGGFSYVIALSDGYSSGQDPSGVEQHMSNSIIAKGGVWGSLKSSFPPLFFCRLHGLNLVDMMLGNDTTCPHHQQRLTSFRASVPSRATKQLFKNEKNETRGEEAGQVRHTSFFFSSRFLFHWGPLRKCKPFQSSQGDWDRFQQHIPLQLFIASTVGLLFSIMLLHIFYNKSQI